MDINTLIISIFNSPIDIKTAGVLSCTCKDALDIIKRKIEHQEITFEKQIHESITCVKCNKRPTKAFDRCHTCLKEYHLLTTTQVKKQYKLVDEDLENLNVHEYHNTYKTLVRLFSPREVLLYSLVKYGGKERMTECLTKKPNMSLQKRQNQLKQLNLDFDTAMESKWGLCIEPFLRNGVGGIRAVKKRIDKYDSFLEEYNKLDLEDRFIVSTYKDSLLEQCVLEGNDAQSIIASKVETEKGRILRRNQLETSLSEKGLHLRKDSVLCNNFIENGHPTLQEVVQIMQEMNYFYTNTSYRGILKECISDWRDEIHYMYGWIPREEYDTLYNSEIEQLRSTAKFRSMHGKRKENVPSFMWRWLT